MRMETEYLVAAKSAEAHNWIYNQLGDFFYGKEVDRPFVNYVTNVLNVMKQVIKVVHQMEVSGQKYEFTIVGKCDTDYDCVLFEIEYAGNEPLIKASQGDPDRDKKQFYQFKKANYKKIPKLLKRDNSRTFKQAIDENLPLGGFLNVSYDEWIKSILSEQRISQRR